VISKINIIGLLGTKKSLSQKKERNYSHLVDFKRQTDSVGMEEMRGSCVAKNRKI
jgi:hypothetical protein